MEFHPFHHAALSLAGTVPLPSPHPASGPVSLVITADGPDLEVFVKILQVVGDKRVITRFVRPEDVRAVRARPDDAPHSGPESWPVLGIRKIKGTLDKHAKALTEKARKGSFEEVVWYAAAIIYVAESAPVLHRNEIAVTAAVSAEEVWFIQPIHCCNIGGH
jgi:hypothetical protein